jgi:hemerythrin-like domain-containing protein
MKHSSLQTIREEHASLAAMLQSLRMMLKRGPGTDPQQYFDVLGAMLFYIDEFPERLHHTKETTLLFPRVLKASPAVRETVERLDHDHQKSETGVRELQHLLMAWELLGESRRQAFEDHCSRYLDAYLEHMKVEETIILPEAEKCLSEADWLELDAAFAQNTDPLNGKYARDPVYDKLYSRIVSTAPAPIGLGQA